MSVESPVTDDTSVSNALMRVEQSRVRVFYAGKMPLPPGINHAYRPLSHGFIGTEALNQFKADAALLLSQGYHDWPIITAIRKARQKVPLRVDLHFFFRYLWKNDIDGPIKFALDAMFTRLEMNDVQIVNLHVTKQVDNDNPRTEIEVYCDLPASSLPSSH